MRVMKMLMASAAASVLALAGTASATEPASWMNTGKALSWAEFREVLIGGPREAVSKLEKSGAAEVEVAVVELPFDPQKLATSVAILGDVVDVVRAQVRGDARLHSALRAEGFRADDVIAMSKSADGAVLLFVGQSRV